MAVATNTHPGPWFAEEERTVMTIVAILEDQADAIKARTKGR